MLHTEVAEERAFSPVPVISLDTAPQMSPGEVAYHMSPEE